MSRWLRPALEGAAAAGCAGSAMVAVAAAGVWLLGVPVSGGLVAAVVSLAVGGDVELALEARTIPMQGTLDAMPLGVTTAGVLGFAAVLALSPRLSRVEAPHADASRQPPQQLAVRGGAALLTSALLAWLAAGAGHGRLGLAGRGTVTFDADPWSTLVGAVAGAAVVLALCWLAFRYEPVRRTVRAVAVVFLAATGVCIVAGIVAGFAGAALLAAPNVAGLAVPYGLGAPLVADLPGLPDPDGRLRLIATAFAAIVVLAIGLLAARPIRAGLAVGSALFACALLGSVSGAAGFAGFDAMAVEVRVNPWLAFLVGLAGGMVSGAIGARLSTHGKPARSR